MHLTPLSTCLYSWHSTHVYLSTCLSVYMSTLVHASICVCPVLSTPDTTPHIVYTHTYSPIPSLEPGPFLYSTWISSSWATHGLNGRGGGREGGTFQVSMTFKGESLKCLVPGCYPLVPFCSLSAYHPLFSCLCLNNLEEILVI